MIQIIAGEKGKGKTKILIEKANTEVNTAKGSIVYLDKSNKHMYELSNKIRLINVRDYLIENQNEFIGFICGINSCDHDIEAIYFDSFLKIAFVNDENIEAIFKKLERISEQFQTDFIISISMNENQFPESVKKYITVSL
ncbi:MAG TPA: twitching motility protein PilT [Clostridiales bacterium]|nr:twitching motility protein PilT [Clostridiales bacterium]